MRKGKADIVIGAAVAALVLAPVCASAADVSGEIATAATHATLAVQSTALDGVQMHLHHTLNCLVGPGGTGFDAKQINPCAGSGNGAIPDESDAAKQKALKTAADTVRGGLATSDLAKARKAATDAASELNAIK